MCEEPTPALYKFQGSIAFGSSNPSPLSHANLLLRGSKLRNTEYVFGTVVYAGTDTKLFKNLKLTPPKVSRLQHQLNMVVLGIFGLNSRLQIEEHRSRGLVGSHLGRRVLLPPPGADLFRGIGTQELGPLGHQPFGEFSVLSAPN